jgi:hypothetical protein
MFIDSTRDACAPRPGILIDFAGAFAVADSHNAIVATVDAPHGTQKEDKKPPQRNELKAPFDEVVVTGRRRDQPQKPCDEFIRRSKERFRPGPRR